MGVGVAVFEGVQRSGAMHRFTMVKRPQKKNSIDDWLALATGSPVWSRRFAHVKSVSFFDTAGKLDGLSEPVNSDFGYPGIDTGPVQIRL